MSTISFLHAKLQIPPSLSRLVPRPRLTKCLRKGLTYRLTLVSAPAGYGKTTLLTLFAAETDLPLVWYTLAPSDNDPATFFDYLITGIAAQRAGFGAVTRPLCSDSRALGRGSHSRSDAILCRSGEHPRCPANLQGAS